MHATSGYPKPTVVSLDDVDLGIAASLLIIDAGIST
jgi:hypothetical protein